MTVDSPSADSTAAPLSQAARRERSRAALLEAAAIEISRNGYSALVLEDVAQRAGYTRGALYHQFKNKDDLTLAVFSWVLETWDQEVGTQIEQQDDARSALLALARGHAVFCRRGIARVAIVLKAELSGRDHPVGHRVAEAYADLVQQCTDLIEAGRRAETIPAGPPAHAVALAFVAAVEGTTVALADEVPHDEVLAVRAATGVLGLGPEGTSDR
jgi:AcrR family transcriptional regulator